MLKHNNLLILVYPKLQQATPPRHCKQFVYVQPVGMSARRPHAAATPLPRAEVSDARLRWIRTRHRQLLVAPLAVRLSEGEQAQEQATGWTGLRTAQVRMAFVLLGIGSLVPTDTEPNRERNVQH